MHNMIFSDSRSWRRKRHFLFWLVVFLYHLLRIGIMMPALNNMSSFYSLLKFTFLHAMITNPFFTYVIVYYLMPKFFNHKRYFLFAFGIVMVFAVIQSYTFLQNLLALNQPVREGIGLSKGLLLSNFKPGFIRMFGNPPLICCLFLSIKILKNWHLEQLKTETLAKENASAEIQLLKAQVHPHFLFNTLNNIYSFSLSQSPQAGVLVKKLSGLLDYMVNECDQQLVPLEKELKLIQDYIGLEKVRYGSRLKLDVEIEGDYKDKLIAPLLMIPFVENCFKHGASVMRGQQWIKLSINIKDDQLMFNLSNSKPMQAIDTNLKKGIGLANVQKRLQLLYPGKHSLKKESTGDTYIVQLQVSLQLLPVTEPSYKLIPKPEPV